MIAHKLARFVNNESRATYRDYTPDNARRLLARFGDPHLHFKSFHVGGTNGKGSVAHMLHSILARAGYSTGLYTSPHLVSVNERIMAGSSPIGDSVLDAYIDDIIHAIERDPSLTPTYFDVLTVCAFRHFHDSRVDTAVIEVGLGGRLDSTNVIAPVVAVITEISQDHTSLLGATPAAIAREKAGIVKPSVPLVTSSQEPEVLSILEEAACEHEAPLYRLGSEFKAHNHVALERGHRFDYRFGGNPETEISGVEIGLIPPIQIANSCCAVTAAVVSRHVFPRIDDNAIRDGLRSCRIPGRFEILAEKPLVIFDPAHNESAMTRMIDFVINRYPGMEIRPVVAFMNDKNVVALADLLRSRRLRGIYFVLHDERCYNPLSSPGTEGVFDDVIVHDEASLFSTLDARIAPRTLFFFTGSFRLYRTAVTYASHCVAVGIGIDSRR